jgi:hypothetical protein
MIVEGRGVQQKDENDGKEEKIMAKGNAQCYGRGKRAMEKEKKLEGTMPKGKK